MNDTMPDFEPTVPPAVEYPKPKKPRRKAVKKRKAIPAVDRSAAIRLGKAKAKKRKAVKRRGRPPGAANKPKAFVDDSPSSFETVLSISSRIEALLSILATAERKTVLEHLLKVNSL